MAIEQQIGQQSATLIAPIPLSTGLADFGQSYVSKVSCAASLAAAVNVSSYVGRIGVNIAGLGFDMQTITTIGGNLFEIAASATRERAAMDKYSPNQ